MQDILRSAAILVPALSGLGMTVCSGGQEELERFEDQYCFSPQLQEFYTAGGLRELLENGSGELIYETVDSLETRLILFRAEEDGWVLLGPYVEAGWDEPRARVLLSELGASKTALQPYKTYRCRFPIFRRDYCVKLAMLLITHTGGEPRVVKTLYGRKAEKKAVPVFASAYETAAVVECRYRLEDQFIRNVSRGELEEAYRTLDALGKVMTDIRFMSGELRDQIAGAAIVRTLIRMGAKLGGLSPLLIDSISQEYAQKMQHTLVAEDLAVLQRQLLERFCREVRRQRKANYSPCVRRAVDYITANLSETMSVSEIAGAAGVDRRVLTKKFGRETGQTIKQYLAEKRCGLAAELLKNSGAGVREIAAFVGYTDSNYFTKVFRACYGMSPQEYRNGSSCFY